MYFIKFIWNPLNRVELVQMTHMALFWWAVKLKLNCQSKQNEAHLELSLNLLQGWTKNSFFGTVTGYVLYTDDLVYLLPSEGGI